MYSSPTHAKTEIEQSVLVLKMFDILSKQQQEDLKCKIEYMWDEGIIQERTELINSFAK